ncbi:hypothetical protein TSAR_008006 [Trichomalopsis sarcophagae]|uniref:Uncharacterized protein n=1 Tax=Trichomalopsis sarcophagae TaxID=543379 RepID=A0A232FNG4_9HYME|nr:hypothetical protein TSAR_008006 [Trichomalopsis sarcophagae]
MLRMCAGGSVESSAPIRDAAVVCRARLREHTLLCCASYVCENAPRSLLLCPSELTVLCIQRKIVLTGSDLTLYIK